jgi:acyl-CoA thioesterase II
VKAVRLQPYPYRARAWWGETVIAESDSCLCEERDGEPSVLWFPESDVARDGLDDDMLSLDSHTAVDPARVRGYGAFDPRRVRVEIFDGEPDGDAREVTIKQFPTWGDSSDLIDVMDVRPDGADRFVSTAHTDGRRPVVEGSQMLGQAIVAAGRLVPDRRVVSASMLFLRAVDAHDPLEVELDELTLGRTFAGLAVRITQHGRTGAAGTLLLDTTAPAVVSHALNAPDVPSPYECPSYDMGVTGRDVRVVDGAYTNDPGAPAGPPVLDCWVRFRHLPRDPALHAGLLAQFTGHMPIATALRPHEGLGQAQAHRTLSMGINAINLSLHGEVRADEWMLYHHHSTFAGDGMTHAECRVHAEDGTLLASFSVDAMVRPFADGRTGDERTAL